MSVQNALLTTKSAVGPHCSPALTADKAKEGGRRRNRPTISEVGEGRGVHSCPPHIPFFLIVQHSNTEASHHQLVAGSNMVVADLQQMLATDFYWANAQEPHLSRRREILTAHPEIKDLFGPDIWAFPKIVVVVLLQLWTAYCLKDAKWGIILAVAYFFGSFLNHNLFLAIHELSHNLAFSTPFYNRVLGIFANLPVGVPMSVTFQKYHLDHHLYQGVEGMDMDIPSYTEGRVIRSTFMKTLWVLFQLFFYALRPLFLNPKNPGFWEATNSVIQISADVAWIYMFGWRSFMYLILSTFVGGGLHPIAGHFISEHYVFQKGQETYSYYGPLNLLAWSVGYHNEHHDFPRIPGSKLWRVKEIAPEYYEGLTCYRSWTQVIYMYIMDASVGPFSRMMRKPNFSTEKKSK